MPIGFDIVDRFLEPGATVFTADQFPALYALPTDPPKPGLVRVVDGDDGAGAIEVEVWDLEPAAFASFVDAIPSPLGIGRLVLDDDTDVAGFVCEPFALHGAPEITAYGGWRAYRAATPG